MHLCSSTGSEPKRRPTAMCSVLLSNFVPKCGTGSAFSHAPDSFVAVAWSRAVVMGSVVECMRFLSAFSIRPLIPQPPADPGKIRGSFTT